MENPMTLKSGDPESAEVKEAVRACIAEIDFVSKQMKADQDEIDHLKSETRAILARLKVA